MTRITNHIWIVWIVFISLDINRICYPNPSLFFRCKKMFSKILQHTIWTTHFSIFLLIINEVLNKHLAKSQDCVSLIFDCQVFSMIPYLAPGASFSFFFKEKGNFTYWHMPGVESCYNLTFTSIFQTWHKKG